MASITEEIYYQVVFEYDLNNIVAYPKSTKELQSYIEIQKIVGGIFEHITSISAVTRYLYCKLGCRFYICEVPIGEVNKNIHLLGIETEISSRILCVYGDGSEDYNMTREQVEKLSIKIKQPIEFSVTEVLECKEELKPIKNRMSVISGEEEVFKYLEDQKKIKEEEDEKFKLLRKELRVCCVCGIKSKSKCGKCHRIYYCGVDCQKNDWISHKLNCK